MKKLMKSGMNGKDVMSKNPRVKYGNKNLLPEKINPEDISVLISIKMEGDLLRALKTRAKDLNRPYQTLMKELLRESLNLKVSNSEDRIREIVRQELKKAAG